MYKIDDPEFIKLIESGVPIERLEKRLRPELGSVDIEDDIEAHDSYDDFSQEGFIGRNENLLETVHADWMIVEKYGTTHAKIADAIDNLFAGNGRLHPDYNLSRKSSLSLGYQSCPWGCMNSGGEFGTIHKKGLSVAQQNVVLAAATGGITHIADSLSLIDRLEQKLGKNNHIIEDLREMYAIEANKSDIFYAPLTDLISHLIREHYFFEGRESLYRADPEFLIKALNLGNK